MRDAALALNDEHLVVLVRDDLFFHRAADEVGHHGVDRAAVPLDHHAGLAGGNELGIDAPLGQAARHLDGHPHFPDAAVVSDGVDAKAVGGDIPPLGHVAFTVAAQVAEGRAAGRGGGGEFGVVIQKLVQPRHHVHPALDRAQHERPHRRGQRAAGRRDADEQLVGLRQGVE